MEKKEHKHDYLSFRNDKDIIKLLDKHETIIFSDQLLKYSPYGWTQGRKFVLTNKFLYNIHRKKLKRRISILNIAAVTITSGEGTEFVIHVPTEYDYRFISERRNEIISLINKLHHKLHARNLPLYSVPQRHLKEYAATSKGKKGNKYTIPDEKFRIQGLEEDKLVRPSGESGKWVEVFEEEKAKSKSIYQRENGETLVKLDDFKLINILGKGSFGTVYLVQKKAGGSLYAMKRLKKEVLIHSESIECTKLEKEILKTCYHPFLVGLEFAFQTPTDIYFVMKYYRGGDLYRHLTKARRFSEDRAKFYAAQIALALGQLHRNNIIYRDIKPENILMDSDGYLAVADFGLSKIVSEGQSTRTFVGTPEYIAPEIVCGRTHNKQADWWSFGVLIYEMLIGIPPFRHKNHHKLFQYITTMDVIFPNEEKFGIKVSSEAKDVIMKLLQKKPEERLGKVKDADEVLAHPFFKGVDKEKLLNKQIAADYKPEPDEIEVTDLEPKIPSIESKEIDPRSMEIIRTCGIDFTDFT